MLFIIKFFNVLICFLNKLGLLTKLFLHISHITAMFFLNNCKHRSLWLNPFLKCPWLFLHLCSKRFISIFKLSILLVEKLLFLNGLFEFSFEHLNQVSIVWKCPLMLNILGFKLLQLLLLLLKGLLSLPHTILELSNQCLVFFLNSSNLLIFFKNLLTMGCIF